MLKKRSVCKVKCRLFRKTLWTQFSVCRLKVNSSMSIPLQSSLPALRKMTYCSIKSTRWNSMKKSLPFLRKLWRKLFKINVCLILKQHSQRTVKRILLFSLTLYLNITKRKNWKPFCSWRTILPSANGLKWKSKKRTRVLPSPSTMRKGFSRRLFRVLMR